MRKILGVLIIVLGGVLAAYVGLYIMFVGGIVQIVNAVTSEPVEGPGIAWGILRIAFASLSFALILWTSVLSGVAIYDRSPYRRKFQASAKTIEQNWKKTIGS